jgi:hypothetical protein
LAGRIRRIFHQPKSQACPPEIHLQSSATPSKDDIPAGISPCAQAPSSPYCAFCAAAAAWDCALYAAAPNIVLKN